MKNLIIFAAILVSLVSFISCDYDGEEFPGLMTYAECLDYEIDNIHMCTFECIRNSGCDCELQCGHLYCNYPERFAKWQAEQDKED